METNTEIEKEKRQVFLKGARDGVMNSSTKTLALGAVTLGIAFQIIKMRRSGE